MSSLGNSLGTGIIGLSALLLAGIVVDNLKHPYVEQSCNIELANSNSESEEMTKSNDSIINVYSDATTNTDSIAMVDAMKAKNGIGFKTLENK